MAWKTEHQTYCSKQIWGRTRRHHIRLVKNHVRLNTRKYFFSQRVISLWNSLPVVIMNSKCVNEFNNRYGPLFEKQRSNCISKRGLPPSFGQVRLDFMIAMHSYLSELALYVDMIIVDCSCMLH